MTPRRADEGSDSNAGSGGVREGTGTEGPPRAEGAGSATGEGGAGSGAVAGSIPGLAGGGRRGGVWRAVGVGARRVGVSVTLCAGMGVLGEAGYLVLSGDFGASWGTVALIWGGMSALGFAVGGLGGAQAMACDETDEGGTPRAGASGRRGFEMALHAALIFHATYFTARSVHLVRTPSEILMAGAAWMLGYAAGTPVAGFVGERLDRLGKALTEGEDRARGKG